MEPREIIKNLEVTASVPLWKGDRFSGYGVIGQPFLSGHVLALRRFPASSLGIGYTTVWHRDPAGQWTFYSTVAPELGCARFFGGVIRRNVVAPIQIEWTSGTGFRVAIENTLQWEVVLQASLRGALMNAVSSLMPESCWRNRRVLKMMSTAARLGLGAGPMKLTGRTPNGYEFVANPRRVWLMRTSLAKLNGVDLGASGALEIQAELGDFLIPQRGVFATATVSLERPKSRMQFSEAAA